MPKGDPSAKTDPQKRRAGASAQGQEQNGAGRPEAGARAWPTVNKLHGGNQKIAARRKLPSGPIGGSGRKTNLSRSS